MRQSTSSTIVNPSPRASWELGAFRMLAESRAADGELGGDFYAFRLRGPKRLGVVIGDACGHGAEGARLLPKVLSKVEDLALGPTQPSHFLQQLNGLLARELAPDRFVTSAAYEIDGNAGTLRIANAGHVPAILRRRSGQVVIAGRASGPPLGIMGGVLYFDETLRFSSGDVLLLMTDGILEAFETDLAGMPRLTALLSQSRGGSGVVHGRVLAGLSNLLRAEEHDDMTLLSLELLGGERPPRAVSRPALSINPGV